MRRKKIIYVITKSNWGGAQHYVYELATSLPLDTYDVSVAFGGRGELARKLEVANIRTIPLPSLERDVKVVGDIVSFFQLISIFLRERPDVIHLNSSKIGGMGALAARIAGVRNIIFTAHGWVFNEDRSWGSKITLRMLSWLMCVFCHQIIVIDREEHKQVRRWPFVQKKFRLVYNGVSKIPFKNRMDARELIAKYCPELRDSQTDIWVGTVSELHRNKGLDIALGVLTRVMVKYSGFQFIIIGEGEERMEIERLIAEKNLEHVVHLTGLVPEARTLLKAFDIFTLTSRKEGLPYALLEASAAGLPVVASKTGGIPEIIDDGKTGLLIEIGNEEKIAEALDHLLGNRQYREEMGQAGALKIANRFTFEQMIERTKGLY